MPFPTDGTLNSGIATTDGRTVFLLFGQIPDSAAARTPAAAAAADPGWFIGMLDIEAKTLVQGTCFLFDCFARLRLRHCVAHTLAHTRARTYTHARTFLHTQHLPQGSAVALRAFL